VRSLHQKKERRLGRHVAIEPGKTQLPSEESIMSIVETTNSKRQSVNRLQGLAGAALVSAAIFVSAPKIACGEYVYTASGNQSWFTRSN
jgi:hypothetical protein